MVQYPCVHGYPEYDNFGYAFSLIFMVCILVHSLNWDGDLSTHKAFDTSVKYNGIRNY